MAHLAGADEIFDCARHVLHRHLWIHPMLIEKIDPICPEPFERRLGDLPDALGAAAQAAPLPGLRVDLEPELGRDHHSVAHGSQGFAHQLLVGVRTIDFGRVEECDAAIDGRADQRDALLLLDRLAIGEAQAHAAEPDLRNLESALAESAFLHCSSPGPAAVSSRRSAAD